MTQVLRLLEEKLGYRFSKIEHLQTALTHSSAGKNNNERFEFLGDSILNFIIGDDLFHKFPEIHEGQLSRMRATLVKGETLTTLAQTFDLSNFMILGPGEMHVHGGCRHSILAGAIEAIIGAIYLDSDFDTCRHCVLFWYHDFLNDIRVDQQHVDAKTQLQELLQAKKCALPVYTIVQQTSGAYQQIFTVECRVEALHHVTQGQGQNRRQAEQIAAAAMLEKIHHD